MSEQKAERITILAREFAEAAFEYHRGRLGEKGYRMAGPIVQHKFMLLEGPQEPTELFDGEPLFAATFVLKDAEEG